MRALTALGLALGLAAAAAVPAKAQEPCLPGANVLGVSRVVEIDTSSGPRFGFQYGEHDILADGEIVLTFDDGPLRAYTKPVLEALAAQCTKATFFVVGRMAVADPDMVREYARRGHTVGTHTWSHANLRTLTPLKARQEMELGFSAVQQALEKPVAPFFRFPYLSDPKSMLLHAQGRGVAIFSIDIDSKDFRTRDPATVHHRVIADLARARKGIILFHDIQPSTARALPGLLAELKARGYRVVHLRPKAAIETVAEYDAIAQQELARRRVASATLPLAKRTLTWPLGEPPQPAAARASAAPASAGDMLAKQPRPIARPLDDDWRTSLWR